MTKLVVSMRDAKVGFTDVALEHSYDTAIRNFSYALNSKDSLLYTNAADFDLWQVGEFDSDTGTIVPTIPMKLICSAVSLKKGE